jgi:hypothetical protein
MVLNRFDPSTSILAGRPTAQLQFDLAAAQQAYIELSSGARVVTAQYTQGDGQKQITYTQASLPNLVALIKELQAQLGLIRHGRRPVRLGYR